jgi:ABC-type phosphate transport system ATPase subunit
MLKQKEDLEKTELYKYFCKVTYNVLNEFDKNVSGGEMAEFNLLRVLDDAKQFDMLLVDEPESSFDNLFLKDDVNKLIKEISREMPVVVVTHNNTVGMLMKPDFILCTKREIINGKDEYNVFSGCPGEKEFKTADGSKTISSYDALLDNLEAGRVAYEDRQGLYNGLRS